MGPSVEMMLTIWSNGSAPLNKIAAVLIYGKHFFSRTKKALRLILGLQHWGLTSNKFIQMIIKVSVYLFTVWSICVQVAVASLEEVAWHLQICSSCFYQVSESWLMGLLFILFSRVIPFRIYL